MQASPYLLFNGQCEAAFRFYARCLDGTIEAMMPHEGTPCAEQVPPDWLKKILHARLRVGDTILLASDCPPDRYKKPEGFSVTLLVKQPAEAERVFHALADNGTVRMPIQRTFWSARFGMLVDQFGIPWMINCEQPA
ncbi:MAG TPA: VOC family protein [Gemmataceae bacterium]|nr:VOC family protein [Gemmataceae bacterium]